MPTWLTAISVPGVEKSAEYPSAGGKVAGFAYFVPNPEATVKG